MEETCSPTSRPGCLATFTTASVVALSVIIAHDHPRLILRKLSMHMHVRLLSWSAAGYLAVINATHPVFFSPLDVKEIGEVVFLPSRVMSAPSRGQICMKLLVPLYRTTLGGTLVARPEKYPKKSCRSRRFNLRSGICSLLWKGLGGASRPPPVGWYSQVSGVSSCE